MRLSRPITHIIYDLDGVLLDTEPFYTQVTQEIVSSYGKIFDWSIKRNMIGRPSLESARYLVGALDLPMDAEEYLKRRGARLDQLFRDSPEKSGAEAFTRMLDDRRVPQAIATSSDARVFELKSSGHRPWFSLFAAVIVGDDPRLKRGKPSPDIFLLAAADLGADPDSCLVFEDSPAGVEAALGAGMQVVALPDPAMDLEPYAGAEFVADDFSSIAASDLGF